MKKFVRGMLLTVLIFPFAAKGSEAAASFIDVDTSHRTYKEVTYLAEGNIVNGADGYFMPSKEVTRAEAAAMLGRALNLNGTKRTTSFKDVDSASFASGYIQSAVDKNIISGYQDGTFRPDQPVKRGEMAILINRAFQYGGKNTVSAGNALMTLGIAQGISAGNFGYELHIKRADFSVFLARAINYKFRTKTAVSFGGDLQVNANSLNVRTGPSTNFPIVTKLPWGTKVTAAYRVGDWVYIRSNAGEGLVSGAYLKGNYPEGINSPLPSGNPLSSQMIVIDPGHGGTDPGAIGYGLQEKVVVLDTALKVKALLAKTPFGLKMTRETDTFVSLSQRVNIAKAAGGDTFVSIHANAYNGSANGTEVFYYNSANKNPYDEDSRKLASAIHNRLIEAWKLYDRGVKQGDLHVLRENSMPATLVELGFIDNKVDNTKLASPYWRQEAAEAIYLGILDYYSDKGFNVSALYKNVN